MATLQTKAIQPSTGSNVDLGTVGDAVLLSSDSIKTNLYKDSGGNTIFQSDGAGTLSNVNSAMVGGGPKLILSQTASSSASVSFTSGIDSTYDRYMFMFVNINPDTDNQAFKFQTSIDGGSNYNVILTSTYFRAYHGEGGAGGAVDNIPSLVQSQGTGFQTISDGIGNESDASMSGELHLYAPSSTTYVKHFICHTQQSTHHDYSVDTFPSGYFNTTTAINAIRFQVASGNFNGIIKMYGIS
jgi:hypothetical protein